MVVAKSLTERGAAAERDLEGGSLGSSRSWPRRLNWPFGAKPILTGSR